MTRRHGANSLGFLGSVERKEVSLPSWRRLSLSKRSTDRGNGGSIAREPRSVMPERAEAPLSRDSERDFVRHPSQSLENSI